VHSDLRKKPEKKLTPFEAEEKIKNWCAYQERYPLETRRKLYEYGLDKETVEQIMTRLIEENFLNEERFAAAFARGKFRIKKWGKQKIKAELRIRKISEYSLNKALKQIDEGDYMRVLQEVIEKKEKESREKNPLKKRFKLLAYAISKGFEKDLADEVLKEMMNNTDY
jgi:regulatory protein